MEIILTRSPVRPAPSPPGPSLENGDTLGQKSQDHGTEANDIGGMAKRRTRATFLLSNYQC